jgi:hypothetical protein
MKKQHSTPISLLLLLTVASLGGTMLCGMADSDNFTQQSHMHKVRTASHNKQLPLSILSFDSHSSCVSIMEGMIPSFAFDHA